MQQFEEHLLSAYLDDELSADERALVERQLAVDPAARELLEDLTRVRTLVATLPTWKGADLRLPPEGNGSAQSALKQAMLHPPETFGEGGESASAASADLPAHSTAELFAEADSDLTADIEDDSMPNVGSPYRTERPRRWTSILALAAGTATLLLGLPYALSLRQPVREVAMHSSAERDQGDTSVTSESFRKTRTPEVPTTAPDPPGSAGSQNRQWRDGTFSESPGGPAMNDREVNSNLRSAGGAEKSRNGRGKGLSTADGDSQVAARDARPVELSMEGMLGGEASGTRGGPSSDMMGSLAYPHESEAMSSEAKQKLGEVQLRGAAGGYALPSAGNMPSDAFDAGKPADAMISPDSPPLATEPSMNTKPLAEVASRFSREGDAKALSAAPLGDSARLGESVPLGESAPAPAIAAEPSLYYSNSFAWSAAEVESNLPQVWNFLGASSPSIAAETGADFKMTKANTDASPNNSPSLATADLLAPNGQAPMTEVNAMPALGFATLPTKQSPEQWYSALRTASPLGELVRLPLLPQQAGATPSTSVVAAVPMLQTSSQESESLDKVGRSRASVKTQTQDAPATALLGRSDRGSGAPVGVLPGLDSTMQRRMDRSVGDTLALFVTVAEARKILETVAANEPTSPSSAPGGVGLPPAWWTQSRSLFENGSSAGDAKVILILNSAAPR